MKRLLLAILLLIPTACHAQSITVARGDWSRTIPNADFAALERAIEVEGQPGDRVHIVGTYTGGKLDMLDLTMIAGGELTGDGPEKSRLIFTAQHDRIGPEDKPEKMAGPALLLPNSGSIRIAGLYLENTPENVHEDGALAGWPGAWTGTSEATFEDCEVKSHDWGLIYDWSLRSNRTVNLRRLKGVAARSFVNLMHAASTYTLAMEDCEIAIDGNLSQSYGESSAADPVTGGVQTPIILRAGTGKATGCTFSVKGMTPPPKFPEKWVPTRIVAVATDQYYSKGAQTTQFTAKNCKVLSIEPGAAKVLKVDDFRWGKPPVWEN